MPGFCVSVRSGLHLEWPEGSVSRDVKAVQSFVCAPEVCSFFLWGGVGLRVLSISCCCPLQHKLVLKSSALWTPEAVDFSKSFKHLPAGKSKL